MTEKRQAILLTDVRNPLEDKTSVLGHFASVSLKYLPLNKDGV